MRKLENTASLWGAAGFAVVWAAAMWWLPAHGWQPYDLGSYQLLGVVVTLVLLVRNRFPVTTLAVVALCYPNFYEGWLSTDLHVAPYLLAGYTVAAQGRLKTVWVLLICETAVATRLLALGLNPRGWPAEGPVQEGGSLAGWNYSRVTTLMTVTAVTVLLGRAAFRQRQANMELLRRQRELERLRQIETDQLVAAERTRIARELHDVVAHHISAVVLRAQAADRVARTQPEQLQEAVRWIALDGQRTLTAMRQVVRVLRSGGRTADPAALAPQTTLADLAEMAARMQAVGLTVELQVPSPRPVLPTAVELATVRIIQESLTNALVHARAGRAVVVIREGQDELLVEVHDDGGTARNSPTVPMAAGARPAASGSGHGLVGMRERAASCGGTLAVGRSALGGWLIRAHLSLTLQHPLGQAEPERRAG